MSDRNKIQPKNLRSLLSELKEDMDLFDFIELSSSWESIVGKMALHTLPLKISYGSLVIATSHPSFSQALSFMEKEIIRKIEAQFKTLRGKIKSIRFEVNPKAVVTQKQIKEEKIKSEQVLHPYSPLVRKYRPKAEEMFSGIEDEEIRESLISLYLQMAANQKKL